jgi:2-hydroxy-3-keto-5-methylthiopentenyl-1-phosphate phosphatase
MVRIPDVYREFDAKWRSGAMTLVEGQRWIWPRLRMREAEFLAAVDEVARFREGFERFFAAAARRAVPFSIASNGFLNYIERTLANAGIAVETRYGNRLAFVEDRIEPTFPFLEKYGCGSCGVCKGKVVDELKARGFRVVFLGDGGSDKHAAGHADELFAVRGESFARWLAEKHVPHREFSTWDEVSEALEL